MAIPTDMEKSGKIIMTDKEPASHLHIVLFCGSYRFDADLFSSGDVAGIPAGSAGISDPPEGRAWGSKTSELCDPHVLTGSNSQSPDQPPGSDAAGTKTLSGLISRCNNPACFCI